MINCLARWSFYILLVVVGGLSIGIVCCCLIVGVIEGGGRLVVGWSSEVIFNEVSLYVCSGDTRDMDSYPRRRSFYLRPAFLELASIL